MMAPRYLLASLMAFYLLSAFPSAHAQLPVDPAVVHGSAVIDNAGNHMTVTNSPNAILDWQSFSIGINHSVHFQQQGATSQVLNRVVGNDPSQIFGTLSSNGGVWLINPHGVLFGQNARIDVAGLVASTLDIANIDFLANRYHFNTAGGSGEIRNQGEILTSLGGRVWLTGDRIHNEGLIQAPGGQIVLAAGKSIELIDSGAPHVVVRIKAPENEIVNLGSLVAANGEVDLHGSIVNQEGIVRANSVGTDEAGRIVLKAGQLTLAINSETQADQGFIRLEADTTLNNQGGIKGSDVTLTANEILQQGEVAAQGGSVTLTANAAAYLDGLVDVSNLSGTGGHIRLFTDKLEGMAGGTLRADGEQGGHILVEGRSTVAFSSTLTATGSKQGGTIEVTGNSVLLLNADLDTSGGTQGGTVHLGGGWQGEGNLPPAREVLIGVGSEVKANGGVNDNAKGGEIAVWSTQSSEHYGSLQAKDGGRIALSSQADVRQSGDLQAGVGGTVLSNPEKSNAGENPLDNLTMIKKVVSGSINGQPVLAEGDNFGMSIALDGDRLAVGTPGDDGSGNDRGAVHLFTGVETNNFAGLTWQKKLTSGANGMPALADSDFFGASVALDGDHLAVGARGTLLSDNNHGAVHLFTGVGNDFSGLTWQKLLASETGADNMPQLIDFDFFGTALALDGDRLVVGASGDSTRGNNRGAVHLFTGVGEDFSKLTWQKKLASGDNNMPALADSDFFGWSLALDGDRLAVGAFGDDTGGSNRGAVHLFRGVGADFSALTWHDKLASGAKGMPRLADSDFFGWSLALDGNRLAVGAFGDDTGGSNRGAVHLFTEVGADFSGRTWQRKITSGTGASNMAVLADEEGFGWSVALDKERLAVGSLDDNSGKGLIYLFNWREQTKEDLLPSERQETVDTSIQAVNVAVSGTRAVLDEHAVGGVIDMVSSVKPIFGRLNLARMSREEMQHLIDERKEFKERLFAEAIYKLELDPSLSDVPLCQNLLEIDSGRCKISSDLREGYKAKTTLKPFPAGKRKTKIATLPQIEQKIVVLFGIDQYADKRIPTLVNAISDTEAVGKLFADKLGYEVHIVKNATRADIVRILNQLATEMEAQDSVVVYYSGHGYLNKKTGGGYWIPADASATDPSSWLSNTSISEMLADISSKQMVMISDSCYSGAFTKEQSLELSGIDAKPTDILAKRSVVVMSSGGDEPVADEGRGGHSIFAWFLMQALQNVDNWKAGGNVFEQVQREVHKSFPQTPQYGAAISAGHERGGDYLFEYRQLEEIQIEILE